MEDPRTYLPCDSSVGNIVVPVGIDAVVTPLRTVIRCVAFTGDYRCCCVLRWRRSVEERAAIVWCWDGDCNCSEASQRRR
jgi:hypothetical protein